AVLLIAGAAAGEDALTAVQTASLTAGLPLCLVLIAMCVGLVRGLSTEAVDPPRAPAPAPLAGLRVGAQERHAATSSSEATRGGHSSSASAGLSPVVTSPWPWFTGR